MRGFVTLATAFALPDRFPKRDEAVLTAFCVVLATLVVQGLTLAPVIRWLALDRSEEATRELSGARASLASAALDALRGQTARKPRTFAFACSSSARRAVARPASGRWSVCANSVCAP